MNPETAVLPENEPSTTADAHNALRLDVRVAAMLGSSREEARRMITEGGVTVAGRVQYKPGAKITSEQPIVIAGTRKLYVSRGGEKLAAALHTFHIALDGLICLDIGASTGGFTDCMLQHGAARVYAIENGTGQMAPALRDDPRVVLHEQKDIRTVTPVLFGHANGFADFAAVDVSFISLTKVLHAVAALLKPDAGLVCLVKPQFEAGPGNINKRGVVKNPGVRRKAVEGVQAYAAVLGFTAIGPIPSPVATDNEEFLLYLTRS